LAERVLPKHEVRGFEARLPLSIGKVLTSL
jgi:hypothetical protein